MCTTLPQADAKLSSPTTYSSFLQPAPHQVLITRDPSFAFPDSLSCGLRPTPWHGSQGQHQLHLWDWKPFLLHMSENLVSLGFWVASSFRKTCETCNLLMLFTGSHMHLSILPETTGSSLISSSTIKEHRLGKDYWGHWIPVICYLRTMSCNPFIKISSSILKLLRLCCLSTLVGKLSFPRDKLLSSNTNT